MPTLADNILEVGYRLLDKVRTCLSLQVCQLTLDDRDWFRTLSSDLPSELSVDRDFVRLTMARSKPTLLPK